MISKETSLRGRSNWDGLGHEEKVEVIAWAARYIQRNELTQTISDDITRVGFGRRQKTIRKKIRVVDKPTLVFYVRKKKTWKRTSSKKIQDRLIPAQIQMQVQLGGRRIQVAIPTDICEELPIPKAQLYSQGVSMRKANLSVSVSGSVCCLVRNNGQPDGPLYLLTCHHVAFSKDLRDNSSSSPNAWTKKDGDKEPQKLGKSTRSAPFGPNELISIDAALILLDVNGKTIGTKSNFWKNHPVTAIDSLDVLEYFASNNLTLYSQFAPIQMEYCHHVYEQPVKYGSQTVRILETIVYKRKNTNKRPIGGDSGGALMSDNILLGMHIAGVETSGYGYAIPSYLLFNAGAFKPRIELADDQIIDE